MATQTDRLLVLQSDGTTSRNKPGDTLQLTSTVLFSGSFTVGAPASEVPLALYPTTLGVSATGVLALNSSGGEIRIGNNADAFPINIGTGAAARTITVGNGTGASSVSLNVGTGLLSLGTNATDHQVSIGSATGASPVAIFCGTTGITIGINATAHPVTIGSVTGASSVAIQAGTGNIDIGVNGVARTINVGTGPATQTINIGTGASANVITVGSTNTTASTTVRAGSGGLFLTMADNILNAFVLQEGGNAYLYADTLNGSEQLAVNTFLSLNQTAGVVITSAETFAQFDVLAILLGDATGRVGKADANDATRQNVVGVALNAAAGAGVGIRVCTITGAFVTPTFDIAPAAADNGKPVYLSTTAGRVSLTVPAVPGDAVIQVGLLAGGNGVTLNPRVLFQPTFLRIV